MSAEAAVRIGVLGTSSIARRRTIPAMLDCPATEVTAIASRDAETARSFAGQFGCAAVTGYDALLARDDVDAVYLPLPTGLHRQWAAEALKAGKHVLVEKPFAVDRAQSAELLDLAEGLGLVLRQNLTFVHHDQHRTVRELVDAGDLGEVRSFHGAFCIPRLPADDIRYRPDLGGGALLDLAVYPIRAAQLFLGDDLDVCGTVLRTDPDTGVDVAGTALLVSADGRPATVEFGFEHTYVSYYELLGSAQRLQLDRAFTPPPELRPVLRLRGQDRAEDLVLAADHQFGNSVSRFAQAILGGPVADPGDAASALATAGLIDRIRDCARYVVSPAA